MRTRRSYLEEPQSRERKHRAAIEHNKCEGVFLFSANKGGLTWENQGESTLVQRNISDIFTFGKGGYYTQRKQIFLSLSGPLKSAWSTRPDLYLQSRFLSFSSEGIGLQPHSQPSICPWIGPVTFLIAFNEKSTRALEGRGGRGMKGGYGGRVECGGVAEECSTKSAFHWSGKPRLLPSPPHSLPALSFCLFWFNIKNVPNDWAETPRGFQWVCVRMCVWKCHTKGQVSCGLRWQRWGGHKGKSKQSVRPRSERYTPELVPPVEAWSQWKNLELVSALHNHNLDNIICSTFIFSLLKVK